MKAAIYSRKSKFTGKGESIENQVQMCKDYANLNLRDKVIDEFIIYEDEGFSGGNTNRPEFQRMMNDAENKKFDILICYRLDRISRNVADFSTTLQILQQYNIDFVSIREQFDTSSPMGRAMIYIASVFAQLERETIAERIKDNMLALARTGRWLGGVPPLGYKSTPLKYVDEDMKEHSMSKLTAVPEELKLVKLIFDKYLETKSLYGVESYLLENHFRTKRGSDFSKSNLRWILTNPVYVKATDKVFDYLSSLGVATCGEPDGMHGLLRYNKQQTKLNKNGKIYRVNRDESEWIAACSSHKGIILDEDWIEAQKILANNKDKSITSARSHNAILTGIIRCASCGSPMQITYGHVSTDGSKNAFYVCTMKKRSKGSRCSGKNVPVKDIDPAILDEIKKLSGNKEKLIQELLNKTKKNLSTNILSKKENLTDLINSKKKQIDGLMEKLALDDDIADIIISKVKSLKKEIIELNNQLTNLNNEEDSSTELQISLEFLKILLDKCSVIDSLSQDDQRELIRGLVSKITWNSETNEVIMTPFFSNAIVENKEPKKK
ncbi:recombinase family protein [Clostridium sp.]|uniref:recombinase family protein n=1 Tax=Clostridium sp. TaxID=1506 RepID=UPI00262CB0C2|nr:recombinase family protein [Clostridium sp.]